jgi:hypothetical protein
LRVNETEESQGLDLSQHGEAGYILEEAVSGQVLEDGVSEQVARDEPRPASEPPNGQRRFSIVVEGAKDEDLIHAWSALCQVGAAPPTAEFRAVYPYLTTVQGNRFRFRNGDPNVVRESLQRLFQSTLGNSAIATRVETH